MSMLWIGVLATSCAGFGGCVGWKLHEHFLTNIVLSTIAESLDKIASK